MTSTSSRYGRLGLGETDVVRALDFDIVHCTEIRRAAVFVKMAGGHLVLSRMKFPRSLALRERRNREHPDRAVWVSCAVWRNDHE